MTDSTHIRIPKALNDRLKQTLARAGDRRSVTDFAEQLLSQSLDQIDAKGEKLELMPVVAELRKVLGRRAHAQFYDGLAELIQRLETIERKVLPSKKPRKKKGES